MWKNCLLGPSDPYSVCHPPREAHRYAGQDTIGRWGNDLSVFYHRNVSDVRFGNTAVRIEQQSGRLWLDALCNLIGAKIVQSTPDLRLTGPALRWRLPHIGHNHRLAAREPFLYHLATDWIEMNAPCRSRRRRSRRRRSRRRRSGRCSPSGVRSWRCRTDSAGGHPNGHANLCFAYPGGPVAFKAFGYQS